MKRRTFLLIALVLGVVATEPRDASAAPDGGAPADTEGGELSKALTGDASALYEIARQAFQSGDVAAALPKFQRAHEISGDPRLLWNMAACEAALKHWARAMTLVDRYLAIGGALLDERDKERAERFRSAAKRLVATVDVTTAPPGVTVAVDGEPVGTTPLGSALYLDAGRRRVQFTKTGYRGIVRIEAVSGGAELTWRVGLERLRIRPLGQ